MTGARPVLSAPAVSTDEIVAVLEALPVRREVHNLGTELQRYGRETVVLPIELRDAILSRLRGEGGKPDWRADPTDAALLADICDNMAEVLKPLPGIPDAPGDAGHG